ncbi:unnamed protein product [Mytilus edulis]|uniref:C-type lectin domain-containing protein n=1 Tax=Mytilus edulis TaxID=6550 RepID=A0A8S3URI9_MYTED|nr:unnamed protein product [Mytilus edulis]
MVYFAKVRNAKIESVYFRLTESHRILVSQNTVDLYSKTLTKCSVMCANNHQCCMVSFDEVNSKCRLDYSGNCCIQMVPGDEWTVIKRKTNVFDTSSSVGDLSFGTSFYKVVDEQVNWTTAKENCICLGGKLAEFETTEENEYIKNELRTLDATVDGHWLGGYNFNNDNDMEWISHPDQVVPFSDMYLTSQTEHLLSCMVYWKSWDYKGRFFCDRLLSYICEFE